ncbi:ParB family chromosome partitioning protein [Mumia flava]|uniref:ParB family chromosome partitioning protein n=1 Tax=Mumia flava TaxID=1348852 RepID=A0A0B2B2I8_9ACTN|nr:ParB/RepB/Spo0J family partition protein [Mumia flava]PJJ57657.1 ParB family chromosome partitioning protein [Mumia flava]
MSPQRRGLGRGLGALIPTADPDSPRQSSDPARPDQPTPADGRRDDHVDPESGASVGGPVSETAAGSTKAEPREDGGRGASSATSAPRAETAPELTPVEGARFAEVPVTSIRPNPRQPREVFDEEPMAELVASISEIGLLQPVVVRPVGDEQYELVMGERRWRATQEAGLDVIPAIVRDTDDSDMLRDALLENLHRAQLNPLEEAAAYQQLLDDFDCTHDELARRIGRSRPQISNTLRLLRLTPPVQRRVAAGVLTAGHARALVGVEDRDRQDQLAQRVVAEGLSVRALEELIALGTSEPEPTRRPRGPKPVAPRLTDLAGRLSDRFDTRVKVDLGKSKGRITVEFASIDDLERIVTLMDPAAGGDASA